MENPNLGVLSFSMADNPNLGFLSFSRADILKMAPGRICISKLSLLTS